VAAVSLAAVPEIENKHYELTVVDLVKNAPGARPYPPCSRITYELGCLCGAGVFGEAVDYALHSFLDGLVKPQECLSCIVTEFDLIDHLARIGPSGQAGFGLDLFP
jgi:hypothetical protein